MLRDIIGGVLKSKYKNKVLHCHFQFLHELSSHDDSYHILSRVHFRIVDRDNEVEKGPEGSKSLAKNVARSSEDSHWLWGSGGIREDLKNSHWSNFSLSLGGMIRGIFFVSPALDS